MDEEEASGDASSIGAFDLAASGASLRESRAEGKQTFSFEQGEHERKVQTATQRHELNVARLQHQQREELKQNELRRHQERIAFLTVIIVIVAGLVVGCLIATLAPDADTRAWAQNGVTVLLGGVVGGVAGYFTGRASR